MKKFLGILGLIGFLSTPVLADECISATPESLAQRDNDRFPGLNVRILEVFDGPEVADLIKALNDPDEDTTIVVLGTDLYPGKIHIVYLKNGCYDGEAFGDKAVWESLKRKVLGQKI